MPASRSATTQMSNTTKVLALLEQADDFLNTSQIRQQTGLTTKQVCVSLVYLQSRKAVITVESNGRTYWAADVASDNRLRRIDEHRKEDEPRTVGRGYGHRPARKGA